jgi:hypothetical protein
MLPAFDIYNSEFTVSISGSTGQRALQVAMLPGGI